MFTPRAAQEGWSGAWLVGTARWLVRARAIVLLAAWAGSTTVWLATCSQLALRPGAWVYAALVPVDILLLGVLALAEGLELAAADLRDKDPEQIKHPAVRQTMREIQQRSAFFFANRQVFVVAIITFVAQTTAYPWLYLPGFGTVTSGPARLCFSFLFTTLTVLWFAQVTPKRLAIINSEVFLQHCRSIWPLIRLVGFVGLPEPTEHLVRLVRRHSSYREQRFLLPSRRLHYWNEARLRGFALDRAATSIELIRGGGRRIRRRFLLLLLNRSQWEMCGTIHTPAPLRRPLQVRVLHGYETPVPERQETIVPDLQAIFEGRSPTGAWPFQAISPAEWPYAIETSELRTAIDDSSAAHWTIHGIGSSERGQRVSETMIALLYEVEASCAPQPDTSWSESIQLPCRHLTMQVVPGRTLGRTVALRTVCAMLTESSVELADETGRLARLDLPDRAATSIDCPLYGVTYTMTWDCLRQKSRTATRDHDDAWP